MPCRFRRSRTVSEGVAPTLSQCSIRSRFSESCLSASSAFGSYQPNCSITRPSRGLRVSIAFSRKKLLLRRPNLFSLSFTDTKHISIFRPGGAIHCQRSHERSIVAILPDLARGFLREYAPVGPEATGGKRASWAGYFANFSAHYSATSRCAGTKHESAGVFSPRRRQICGAR